MPHDDHRVGQIGHPALAHDRGQVEPDEPWGDTGMPANGEEDGRPAPPMIDREWRSCGLGSLEPGQAARFVQILRNTIPSCSGHGTASADLPDAWWFRSAHPGLTTMLWVCAGGVVRDLEASLRYTTAGPRRLVDVEQDRWRRVIEAARQAFPTRDAGRVSSSLHLGGEPKRTTQQWVTSMGGPLVVLPVSAVSDWQGFSLTDDSNGSTQSTDYDRACSVEGMAGVITYGHHNAQALVLRSNHTACYIADLRTFVHWLGADHEHDLMAAAQTVLTDETAEWEPCGSWETDGSAVLKDSFIGGLQLPVEHARSAGLPDPAPVPIEPGRWAVQSLRRTVHSSDDGGITVGLVRLAHEQHRGRDRT